MISRVTFEFYLALWESKKVFKYEIMSNQIVMHTNLHACVVHCTDLVKMWWAGKFWLARVEDDWWSLYNRFWDDSLDYSAFKFSCTFDFFTLFISLLITWTNRNRIILFTSFHHAFNHNFHNFHKFSKFHSKCTQIRALLRYKNFSKFRSYLRAIF